VLGGASFGTTVKAGFEIVASGGRAVGTMLSGGRLSIAGGATVSASRLAGGTEVVAAGGIISGTTAFGAHGTLSLAASNGEDLSILGFHATDTINLTNFKFGAGEKLSFIENLSKTAGTLTVTEGALKFTATLFGQYVAAGFHFAKDGAGTAITYAKPPGSTAAELALTHT
jgi:autotransporter passenger strand-loop-strand repeat protein